MSWNWENIGSFGYEAYLKAQGIDYDAPGNKWDELPAEKKHAWGEAALAIADIYARGVMA